MDLINLLGNVKSGLLGTNTLDSFAWELLQITQIALAISYYSTLSLSEATSLHEHVQRMY